MIRSLLTPVLEPIFSLLSAMYWLQGTSISVSCDALPDNLRIEGKVADSTAPVRGGRV